MTHEEKISQSGEKQLKIFSKYYPREEFRAVSFPEIRLAGKWLQDLGFECGEAVMVRYSERKLEITLIAPVGGRLAQTDMPGHRKCPSNPVKRAFEGHSFAGLAAYQASFSLKKSIVRFQANSAAALS